MAREDSDLNRLLAADEARRRQRLEDGDETVRLPTESKKTEKPVSFADRFLRFAQSRLRGQPTLVDQLLFVYDVAGIAPDFTFFSAIDMARRISIAADRTGYDQELGRRAQAALEATRTELHEHGLLVLADVVKLGEEE